MEIVTEAFVARMAYILGEDSAAAKALADWHRRRAAGEDPIFILAGQSIFVGPDPASLPSPDQETDR